MTAISRSERLIVALDVPSAAEARALAEQLGDAVRFYKVGLELFSADGYFELIEWLVSRGNKVFADLKLLDIPETVKRATANLSRSGATFLTVHAHRSVLEAAAREKRTMQILAVTVLTSFDQGDLAEMGATKTLEARRRGGGHRLRRGDFLAARGGEDQGALQGPVASGDARHPPGRRRIRRRPETDDGRRPGIRRRRRLHRRRQADSRGGGPSRRCAGHATDDRRHFPALKLNGKQTAPPAGARGAHAGAA
jgi:orotidine-5'-phosphate decarboxylase